MLLNGGGGGGGGLNDINYPLSLYSTDGAIEEGDFAALTKRF